MVLYRSAAARVILSTVQLRPIASVLYRDIYTVRAARLRISDGTHESKEAAAGALRNLAQQNHHEHSLQIFERGAVPALVQLLVSGSARAQAAACGTLYALSHCRPEHQRGIVEAGAVKPITRLLTTGGAKVQEEAASALAALDSDLSHVRIVLRFGAVRPLVTMLKEGSAAAQAFAAQALENIRQRGCSVVASGGSGGNGGSGDGGSDGGGDGGGEGGGDGVPVTTTRPPREGRTRRPQMVAGEARSRGSDLPGCLSRPEPVWMDSFRVPGQYATTKDKSWWPVQAALRASASWPRSEVDSLSRPMPCPLDVKVKDNMHWSNLGLDN